MNLLRVILATVVIFATGACTGYFLAGRPAASPASVPAGQSVLASTNAPPDWNKRREEMRTCLQKEIKATDEQMARVDEILADSRRRTRDIWQTIKGPMESEVLRVQEEIRGVLTPEQAAKYEEIMRQRNGRKNGRDKAQREQNSAEPQACSLKGAPDHRDFL